jgi:hypothetical protein
MYALLRMILLVSFFNSVDKMGLVQTQKCSFFFKNVYLIDLIFVVPRRKQRVGVCLSSLLSPTFHPNLTATRRY